MLFDISDQNTHPLVDECLVMGIYNYEQGNELATAFVSISKNANAMNDNKYQHGIIDSIRTHVESQVPETWYLRGGIYIINAFPRTPLGKVRRTALYEDWLRNLSVQQQETRA